MNTNTLKTKIDEVIDQYKSAVTLLRKSFNNKNKSANNTNNINNQILEILEKILSMITEIDKLFTGIIGNEKYAGISKLTNANAKSYPVNNMIKYIESLDEQIRLKNLEKTKGYLGKIREALTSINNIGKRLGVSPTVNLTNIRKYIANNPSNNTRGPPNGNGKPNTTQGPPNGNTKPNTTQGPPNGNGKLNNIPVVNSIPPNGTVKLNNLQHLINSISTLNNKSTLNNLKTKLQNSNRTNKNSLIANINRRISELNNPQQ